MTVSSLSFYWVFTLKQPCVDQHSSWFEIRHHHGIWGGVILWLKQMQLCYSQQSHQKYQCSGAESGNIDFQQIQTKKGISVLHSRKHGNFTPAAVSLPPQITLSSGSTALNALPPHQVTIINKLRDSSLSLSAINMRSHLTLARLAAELLNVITATWYSTLRGVIKQHCTRADNHWSPLTQVLFHLDI